MDNVLGIHLVEPIDIPGLDRPRKLVYRNYAYRILMKRYKSVREVLKAYDAIYAQLKKNDVNEETVDAFLFFLYAGLAQDDKEQVNQDATLIPLSVARLDEMLSYGNQVGLGAYMRIAFLSSLPLLPTDKKGSKEGDPKK
jgi:hypothetical protein